VGKGERRRGPDHLQEAESTRLRHSSVFAQLLASPRILASKQAASATRTTRNHFVSQMRVRAKDVRARQNPWARIQPEFNSPHCTPSPARPNLSHRCDAGSSQASMEDSQGRLRGEWPFLSIERKLDSTVKSESAAEGTERTPILAFAFVARDFVVRDVVGVHIGGVCDPCFPSPSLLGTSANMHRAAHASGWKGPCRQRIARPLPRLFLGELLQESSTNTWPSRKSSLSSFCWLGTEPGLGCRMKRCLNEFPSSCSSSSLCERAPIIESSSSGRKGLVSKERSWSSKVCFSRSCGGVHAGRPVQARRMSP